MKLKLTCEAANLQVLHCSCHSLVAYSLKLPLAAIPVFAKKQVAQVCSEVRLRLLSWRAHELPAPSCLRNAFPGSRFLSYPEARASRSKFIALVLPIILSGIYLGQRTTGIASVAT